MKRRIIAAIIILAVTSFFALQIFSIPKFFTYDEQKKYTDKLHQQAGEYFLLGYFSSNRYIAKVIYELITQPKRRKAAKAYDALFKYFPDEANNDVNALRPAAQSFKDIKNYKKTVDFYRKDLEIFKRDHFEKFEGLAKGFSYSEAKKMEYLYLAEDHWAIGGCYNAMGEYENAIKEYQKVLDFMPATIGLKEYDRSQIFEIFYITIAKIYKIKFKEYDKAIALYAELGNEFPKYSGVEATLLTGDTYLMMGNIQKAKEIYEEVVKKNKYPGSTADFPLAEKRIRELRTGKVLGDDGIFYEIKDGKVSWRLI